MRYKVSILLLLCVWLFALPASAQRIVTIVGGVVTANVADNADFLVNLNQNVTGVTLIATTGSAATPVTPATGYVISMKFVQDAIGGRTVAFGGNITTTCAINATANAVTICRFQYTASGNTWADQVPVGTIPLVTSNPAICTTGQTFFNTASSQFLLCVATNTLATAAGSPATDVDATLFGVAANTQYVLDATWTLNQTSVSSATGAFKATDTGKACTGISNTGTNTLPVGTFTFLTSTTGTCSVTATASQTNGTFVWGTDDTAAMQAAWTAILTRPALGAAPNASCGGHFLMPYGFIWITQNPATTVTPTSCGQFDTEFPQYYVEGQGFGSTVFFLAPSFGFNQTTAGGCRFGSLAATCLFGTGFTHYRGFGATTLGFVPTFGGTANVLSLGANSTAEQINIFNMGNPTNLTGISITGQTDFCHECVVDAAGANGFSVSAQDAQCFNCWTNSGLTVQIGALFNDYGGGYGPHSSQDGVSVLGTMNMFGTYANAISTNFAACSLGANAVLNIYSTNSPVAGLGACRNAGIGAGILFRGTNATVSLSSAQVTGGGTGGAISTNGGNTGNRVIDLGNNVITGTMANFTNGIYIGEANSANLTAVTAAKLVLSAGWGSTAAVTALTGGNAPIQFTITNSGTGQGASPTITYTFPIPYIIAPFSCTATQTGGTNATGTFTSSALSVTGVTFTFSLTPTAASTEIVQVTCVTP